MYYDLLGRRSATNDEVGDLSDSTPERDTATIAKFDADAQDPYAEATDNRQQPSARWMLRSGNRLIGELRAQATRYHIANHQGSIIMTANSAATPTATFDHDTWGEPLTGPISLASGSAPEVRHNIYSYTGMREASAGNTTHHHARDYNAELRSWLQTDQYMDPWRDLGLSLDPTTRDRHAYVGNNPISYVDPWGHDGCSLLVAPVACAPGTDQNQDTGNAGGGGACRCTAQGQPHPGGTAGRAPGGSGNGATQLDAGETWRPQPVRFEARESTAPIVVDAPSLPLDQRISAELDRRANPYVGPFVDAASEGDLVGGCVSPGYSTKRGIPFVRPKGMGGELIVCVTNVGGDWAVPISLSGGPGGGGGVSFTAGPIFTNAQKTSGVGGWSFGGGASVQAGPIPAVVNVDYGYGPSGKANSVFVGIGPGRGAEYHQRNVYTWTPGGGG